MKIISHRYPKPEEDSMTLEKVGGPNDGEIFKTVIVTLEDGSTAVAWISNLRPGYFKQAFIPWDWNPPPTVVRIL